MRTMEGKAVGRLAMVSMHLMPPQRSGVQQMPAYSSSSSSSSQVNKKESNYEKVHGQVSTESVSWRLCTPADYGPPFTDIIYEKANGEGIAKITINRPARRNAFRPQTLKEMTRALNDARDDTKIGVIILTGKGNDAFCSGGDQSLRGPDGYADKDSFGRLNVLDVQLQIRRLPKPVIAMVAGYAVGGGHVLHMVCDLTIAANNAIFGQTGPKVGSFDAGYGCTAMARLVGPKRAREMWFLCRFYSAKEAMEMGLVNVVVPQSQFFLRPSSSSLCNDEGVAPGSFCDAEVFRSWYTFSFEPLTT